MNYSDKVHPGRQTQHLNYDERDPAQSLFRLTYRRFRSRIGAAALVVLSLLVAAPVFAQDSVLVSNINVPRSSGVSSNTNQFAQKFTTGTNRSGYILTSADIDFLSGPPDNLIVRLTTERPTASSTVITFTNPNTPTINANTFTAPPNTMLAANTDYYLWMTANNGAYARASSGDEDAGSAEGWTIADESLSDIRFDGALNWTTDQPIKIRIRGSEVPPVLQVLNKILDQSARVGSTFEFTFPEDTFDGVSLTYTAARSNDTALPDWLTFNASTRTFSGTPPAEAADTVVMVKVTASDSAGDTVSDTFDIVVAEQDTTAPTLRGVTLDERTLSLIFDEELNRVLPPPASSFEVMVGDNLVTFDNRVRFSNPYTVTLTLDQSVMVGSTATVHYTKLPLNPLRDTVGNEVDSFSTTVKASPLTPAETQSAISTLTAIATHTASAAANTIGLRLDATPLSSLTLAGQSVSFDTASTIDNGRDCTVSGSISADQDCMTVSYQNTTSDNLLGSSAFSLALGATSGGGSFDSEWAIWGRVDRGTFEGRAGDLDTRYEGDSKSSWLGFDARNNDWIAGMALSNSTSDAIYGNDNHSLETSLTTLWNYGSWELKENLALEAVLGIGEGELSHHFDDEVQEGDLFYSTTAIGVRWQLETLNDIDLSVRTDAIQSRLKVEGTETQVLYGLKTNSWRVRSGIKASKTYAQNNATLFEWHAEAALREDGGDGQNGTGVEVALGVRFTGNRFDVETHGRSLVVHTENDLKESGASLTIRMLPQKDGRGLSLSLSPRWGAHTGGADTLWNDRIRELPGSQPASLNARIGYGFNQYARGLITSFAETGLNEDDSQRLRLGVRFDAQHQPISAELAGERYETADERSEHSAHINYRVQF